MRDGAPEIDALFETVLLDAQGVTLSYLLRQIHVVVRVGQHPGSRPMRSTFRVVAGQRKERIDLRIREAVSISAVVGAAVHVASRSAAEEFRSEA